MHNISILLNKNDQSIKCSQSLISDIWKQDIQTVLTCKLQNLRCWWPQSAAPWF